MPKNPFRFSEHFTESAKLRSGWLFEIETTPTVAFCQRSWSSEFGYGDIEPGAQPVADLKQDCPFSLSECEYGMIRGLVRRQALR